MSMPFVDLTGRKFNRLTAVEFVGFKQYTTERKRMWRFLCDCGNEIVTAGMYVTGGGRKSCGCIIGKHKRTHGQTGTPEFMSWGSMLRRCQNKTDANYYRYGGRGIRVCDRWQEFENFLVDMGVRPSPAHSIDRIDNDGHYEPGNCRWATMREQSNNRRSNRRLTINGVTKTYGEWDHSAGLKPGTVSIRLSHGWQDSDVLLPPMKRGGTRIHRMRRHA